MMRTTVFHLVIALLVYGSMMEMKGISAVHGFSTTMLYVGQPTKRVRSTPPGNVFGRPPDNTLLVLSSSSESDGNSSEQKKETTWDRLTGPKLFKTVTNWKGNAWY